MKIQHKQTGEITEVSYRIWETQYMSKNLGKNYKILEIGDIVKLNQIEKNGTRKPLFNLDRDHAIRMIKSNPSLYEIDESVTLKGVKKVLYWMFLPITFIFKSNNLKKWVDTNANVIIIVLAIATIISGWLIAIYLG